MRHFDLAIPFFLPVWRRVLTVVLCIGWACIEFRAGSTFWAILFLVCSAFIVWQFANADWAKVIQEEKERLDKFPRDT